MFRSLSAIGLPAGAGLLGATPLDAADSLDSLISRKNRRCRTPLRKRRNLVCFKASLPHGPV